MADRTPTPSKVQRFVPPKGGEDVSLTGEEANEIALQRAVPRARGQRVAVRDEATLAIRELAERQHGVVAWRQLIARGLGPRSIESRVRRGQLLKLHRGVFAVGHRRIGLYGEWMAAVLAAGPNAFLSHGSAAHLWGMRGSRGVPEVIRVSGHRRPHGTRLHQTRSLPLEDTGLEAGIPVTSVERTAIDIAGGLDDRQLEHALVAVERSGLLRWPELERVLEQSHGRKGLRRLRRVAARVDPRSADAVSPTEVDFVSICREANLPPPQVNVLVEGRKVDFYWPKARLIVETDGYTFHKDRPAFERDRESTVALMAAGYKVLRATDRMLKFDAGRFLSLVEDSLRL